MNELTLKPSTDFVETDRMISYHIQMPGAAKDQIHVKVRPGHLQVDGEIFSGGITTRRRVGRYERDLPIPATYNLDRLQTNIVEGGIRLVLPK